MSPHTPSPLREQARSLYLDGMIDADIARELGITRERVRQFRNAVNTTKPPFPPSEWVKIAAGCAGVTDGPIRQWVREGRIPTSASGLVRIVDVRAAAENLRARACNHCGERLNSVDPHRRFCGKCGQERKRYNYPFLDEAGRRTHRTAVERWRHKNRELTILIQRRSRLTWKLVHQGVPREEARKLSRIQYPPVAA